ncbi:hypothetical protein IAQ61_004519, partial [Plenodomus lingam]|uniref:uncharacterized protein n=1 Tax=Leptosphaeria maculans TaxID=5022 RepID=UPI00332C32EE
TKITELLSDFAWTAPPIRQQRHTAGAASDAARDCDVDVLPLSKVVHRPGSTSASNHHTRASRPALDPEPCTSLAISPQSVAIDNASVIGPATTITTSQRQPSSTSPRTVDHRLIGRVLILHQLQPTGIQPGASAPLRKSRLILNSIISFDGACSNRSPRAQLCRRGSPTCRTPFHKDQYKYTRSVCLSGA